MLAVGKAVAGGQLSSRSRIPEAQTVVSQVSLIRCDEGGCRV